MKREGTSRETGARERMVDATTRLLRSQGYHGTGLNQIVQESRAPKGSLYHYFPGGKEELTAEAIRQGGKEAMGDFAQALTAGRTFVEGAQLFLEMAAQKLEESDFLLGCPMAAVALEAAGESDLIQQACSCSFSGLEQSLVSRLLVEGYPAERAADLAVLLLAAFEGALVLCRAHRTSRPMRVMARVLPSLLQR